MRPREAVARSTQAVLAKPGGAVVAIQRQTLECPRVVDERGGPDMRLKEPPVVGRPLGEWVKRAVKRPSGTTRITIIYLRNTIRADPQFESCPGSRQFRCDHSFSSLPLELKTHTGSWPC